MKDVLLNCIPLGREILQFYGCHLVSPRCERPMRMEAQEVCVSCMRAERCSQSRSPPVFLTVLPWCYLFYRFSAKKCQFKNYLRNENYTPLT